MLAVITETYGNSSQRRKLPDEDYKLKFFYAKHECRTMCHHVQSGLKKKAVTFMCIHKPNSFACSSPYQVQKSSMKQFLKNILALFISSGI